MLHIGWLGSALKKKKLRRPVRMSISIKPHAESPGHVVALTPRPGASSSGRTGRGLSGPPEPCGSLRSLGAHTRARRRHGAAPSSRAPAAIRGLEERGAAAPSPRSPPNSRARAPRTRATRRRRSHLHNGGWSHGRRSAGCGARASTARRSAEAPPAARGRRSRV